MLTHPRKDLQMDLKHTPTGYAIIHLADDEWNNETMRRVASEYFADHPECQFVEVYEHAGWFLGIRRDGSTWSSANDSARLTVPRPQPKTAERVIRRGEDTNYWMLRGRIIHAGSPRLADCSVA